MSAFYCQNCNECRGHDEVNLRDDGKCFCNSCYAAFCCSDCGEEVKQEGDICWDCALADSH